MVLGSGDIIVPADRYDKIKGVSKVTRPLSYQYANAIGAAIAQVSGQTDKIYSLEERSREQVLQEAKDTAVAQAVDASADPDTVQVVEVEEIALPYLPGNAVRVRVKAVGDLVY